MDLSLPSYFNLKRLLLTDNLSSLFLKKITFLFSYKLFLQIAIYTWIQAKLKKSSITLKKKLYKILSFN